MITRAIVRVHTNDGRNLEIPCHRHCDVFRIMKEFGYGSLDFVRTAEGFETEDGRFLDRIEAAQYAYDCGQLTVSEYENLEFGCLYSEDLW